MATNDWKAELKRRIQSIRDKKQQDSDTHGNSHPFQHSSVAPVSQPDRDESPINDDDVVDGEHQEEDVQAPTETTGDHNLQAPVEDDAKVPIQDKQPEEKTSFSIPKSSPVKRESRKKIDAQKRVDKLQTNEVEEEELTLFPVKPEFNNEGEVPPAKAATRIDSSTSSDSKGTTAAPFVTEAEEVIDSYTPLESYAVQNTAVEKESQTSAKAYPHDRYQRQTNMLRLAAATTDAVILAASEATIIWVAGLLAETNPFDLFTSSLWSFGWLFMALHFVYYVLFTSTTGQTPGKSAFGLKVVGDKQGTIGIGKGIARWLFMLLSLAPAAFGYIFLFFNRNGRSLYDLALGHQVQKVDR